MSTNSDDLSFLESLIRETLNKKRRWAVPLQLMHLHALCGRTRRVIPRTRNTKIAARLGHTLNIRSCWRVSLRLAAILAKPLDHVTDGA